MSEPGDLKVWWKPQVPCASFDIAVSTVEEAKLLLKALADYDIFQFEHRIKPDYCNAGGLLRWHEEPEVEESGWYDWYDVDGRDIDDIMNAERGIT